MPALEATDISVHFGGVTALDHVSLTVEAGTITGLIGPNGAGKTTLFDALTGLQGIDHGSVRLNGRDITRLAPHRRNRLGLARTFQRLELFSGLTVRENIECAAGMAGRTKGRPGVARSTATALMDRLGLASIAHVRAGVLPTGQARLVEVARALATSPKVLLLDEPASGQSGTETLHLGRLLRELAADGIGILVVEHDLQLVMSVCSELVVLEFGKVIASGSPDTVRRDPAVLAAYLGSGAGRG